MSTGMSTGTTAGTSQARSRVPRFAEAAVERARLTVVPRQPQRAAKVPFVALVSLLLVGGVVGLLLFNTSMQQASFAATSMEQRAGLLDAREQSLQMELDTLRNPQRVAARAKELGMVPAAGPAFLRLSDGSVLGNPEVARPDDAMRIAPLPTPKPKSLRPDPVVLEVTPEKSQKKRDTARASTADADSPAGRNDDEQDSRERQREGQGGER